MRVSVFSYVYRLILLACMQIFTWILTPILPIFKVCREGWCNNNTYIAWGPRLPVWLAWFDTPDNCLRGDENWDREHVFGYMSVVGWLYRNSLYGFKWTVLSLPEGHPSAWQWHKEFYFKTFYLDLNFGWMLDNIENGRAMFMFSPRIKRIPND